MGGEEVFHILPKLLTDILDAMQADKEKLQELRVRAGRPVLAYWNGKETASQRVVSQEQVNEVLAYLSSYSLYAYEEEISQGFLTLPGGHRVGLAGKAVMEDGKVRRMVEISSLNIRFAHEVKGCADPVFPKIWEGESLCSTLIVASPGGGKTTLLRDLIRKISNGNSMHEGRTVGVVDERSEIAGSFRGMPGCEIGVRTDVLDGCPKAEGMMMLVRSMAPQVLAVDEIGGRCDLEAMEYAVNCGCTILATVHGKSLEELRRKPVLREMLGQGIFERYLLLDDRKNPGDVRQVLRGDGGVLYPKKEM